MLEDGTALHLISRYGYPAVLLGTVLEGETVVLVAGFLAHQGYLGLPGIMIAAFAGSTISDQGLFSRPVQGRAVAGALPQAGLRGAPSDRLHGPPPGGVVYLHAFVPLSLRAVQRHARVPWHSRIPSLAFMLLNVLGAVPWAVSFSLFGYVFAKTLSRFMDDLARYELYVLVGLVLLGVLIAAARRAWAKRHGRP